MPDSHKQSGLRQPSPQRKVALRKVRTRAVPENQMSPESSNLTNSVIKDSPPVVVYETTPTPRQRKTRREAEEEMEALRRELLETQKENLKIRAM